MPQMMTAVGRLMRRNDGQDLLEYGLLAALFAVAAMVSVAALGETIHTVFWSGIGSSL